MGKANLFAQVVLTFGFLLAFVPAFVANSMFHAVTEEEAANVGLRGIQTEARKSCLAIWRSQKQISHGMG